MQTFDVVLLCVLVLFSDSVAREEDEWSEIEDELGALPVSCGRDDNA